MFFLYRNLGLHLQKLLQSELLFWLKYAKKNRLSAGALPQTPVGELTGLPEIVFGKLTALTKPTAAFMRE